LRGFGGGVVVCENRAIVLENRVFGFWGRGGGLVNGDGENAGKTCATVGGACVIAAAG